MKSRKTQKRSSKLSPKAELRKKLFGRGSIEKLEDRHLMSGDGLVYPLGGLYTGKILPSLTVEEYIQRATGGSSSSSSSSTSSSSSSSSSSTSPADSYWENSLSVPEGAGTATTVSEVEPNNIRSTAQFLNLGFAPGASSQLEVLGLMSIATQDEDFYAFDLRGGDILDVRLRASLIGGAFDLSLTNAAGLELAGNDQPVGFPLPVRPPYPASSPLMTDGDTGLAVVIPTDGRYFLRVGGGDRSYVLSLRTHRPNIESQPIGTKQKLFLDFDGAQIRRDTFDPLIPSQTTLTGTARLSPLSTFLTGWGLSPQSESAVIDRILSIVKQTFEGLKNNGNNGFFSETGVPGDFDIEILNSRDNPDVWGLPNVSRIVVGGTAAELGIGGLLGIAESIDVGNFDREETAVVLLDAMLASYGGVQRAADVPLIAAITSGIANTIVHEAGHFFGAWHVLDNTNVQVMDTIGLASDNVGAGPDAILGTADDILVPFGTDIYDPIAGQVRYGNENTAATIAHGLSTGTIGAMINGKVYVDSNLNRQLDGGEAGLSNFIVYADLNNNAVLDSGEPKVPSRVDGTYTLAVVGGSYTIRQQVVPGFKLTAPVSGSYSVTVSTGQSVQGFNFGNERIDQTATGFKWNDLNGNGLVDASEPRMSGVWIYIDVDRDGVIDLGEPSTVSDSSGRYTLRFPGPGTYAVRETLAPGFVQTFPGPLQNNQHVVTVTGNSAIDSVALAGLNFGNRFHVDLGDAPNSYGTLRSSNGPAHGQVVGLFLGQNWDAEQDGQPSATALGDDSNGALDFADAVIDDEDGITLARPISRTETNVFNVSVTNITSAPAFIQAWIDLNGDGDFTDSGEKVVSNAAVPSGSNGTTTVTFPALGGAKLGDTYARVRLSYTRDLGPTGIADSGEVEDYRLTIVDAPNIANNDTFQVSRNSTLNSLDVTANDFRSAGEVLTIVSVSTSTAGAILQITSDNKILYTPPSGFIGKDTFTYTILTESGATYMGSVSVDVNLFFEDPVAVDDSFNVPTNAISVPLNVLANDIEGRDGALSIISVTQPNLGGQITISTGGQSLRYTPARDAGGTEQFTYTVADAAGKSSTATVTLHTLPGDQVNDQVSIRLVATDLNGNPITAVPQGQDFKINVFLDDLRFDSTDSIFDDPDAGVFAAYLDLLYDLQLVSTAPSAPGNRFDFDVQFFEDYTNFQRGDASIPGIIDDFGAFNSLAASNGITMNKPDEVLMASVRFTARAPGIAAFKADPADDSPDTDTILFNVPGSTVPTERIRFVGTTLEIVGDSVEFPQAVDDSFATNVPAGIINFPLNVLPNDSPGSTGVIRLMDVLQPANGSVTINNNGTPSIPGDDRILYTPNVGFKGTDSFRYTIQDVRGVQSSATVTVRVGSVDDTNANDDVSLRLQIYKSNGTPLADGENLTVGQQFQLRGFVQDLRNPFGDKRGVFAAFEDLLYTSGTVSPVANSSNPLGFQIQFGEDFTSDNPQQQPNVHSGDNRTPGLINEVGAVQADLQNSLGTSEKLLFTITFTANKTGVVSFVGDPADILPLHDTLLFDPPTVVGADNIRFGFDSANVVAASGGAGGEAFTNSANAFDVNADGSVTPIDALIVINSLNSGGVTAAGEGEQATKYYVDVNGDGSISPLDALLVINRLNVGGAGEGEAAPIVLSNRLASAQRTEVQADSGFGSVATSSTRSFDSSDDSTSPSTASLDWALVAEGESDDSLDDLVSQLAGDVGSYWKRK